MVENLPANPRDVGLIPGLERATEVGNATHSSILASKILCTWSMEGYNPSGCRQLDMTEYSEFIIAGTLFGIRCLLSKQSRTMFFITKEKEVTIWTSVNSLASIAWLAGFSLGLSTCELI